MDARPEITTPIGEKHAFSWRAFILWPFVILLLYVLSWGPVLMMWEKNRTSPEVFFVLKFYSPVDWFYRETPLHTPLGMYLHLWVPAWYDKKGDTPYWS